MWTAAGSFLFVAAVLALFSLIGSDWLERRMGGQQLLDVMLWPLDPWRSPEVVTATLEAYGDQGRQLYLGVLIADTMFAGLYSVLLAVWGSFAARQLQLPNRVSRVATVFPMIGGLVFDWGENLLLGVQTIRFPQHSDAASWFALALSELKLLAYIESFLVLPFALLAFPVRKAIWKKLRRKASKANCEEIA